jgi:hypothetical protein
MNQDSKFGESDKHRTIKLMARKYLEFLGYVDSEITEEYDVEINKKKYRVDVVGISDKRKTAIECGNTSPEKYFILHAHFDDVILFPYLKVLYDQLERIGKLEHEMSILKEEQKTVTRRDRILANFAEGEMEKTLFAITEDYYRLMLGVLWVSTKGEPIDDPYKHSIIGITPEDVISFYTDAIREVNTNDPKVIRKLAMKKIMEKQEFL